MKQLPKLFLTFFGISRFAERTIFTLRQGAISVHVSYEAPSSWEAIWHNDGAAFSNNMIWTQHYKIEGIYMLHWK